MGRVPNQEQTGTIPAFKSAGLHGEDGDLFPFGDCLHPLRKSRHDFRDIGAQVFQAGSLDLAEAIFEERVFRCSKLILFPSPCVVSIVIAETRV